MGITAYQDEQELGFKWQISYLSPKLDPQTLV
jgi:hypothetical protein